MFKNLRLFSSIPCPNQNTCSLFNCIFSHDHGNQLEQQTTVAASAPTNLVATPRECEKTFTNSNHPAYRERSCESTDSSESGGVSLANYLAEEEQTSQGRVKRRKVEKKDEASESGASSCSSSSYVRDGVPLTGSVGTGNLKKTKIHKSATSRTQSSEEKKPKEKMVTQSKAPLVPAASLPKIADKKEPQVAPPSAFYSSGNRQIQIAQALRQQNEVRQAQKSQATPNPTRPVSTATKSVILTPRPLIREPASGEIRLQLLKLLHGEYTRLYNTTTQDPDIITIALDEEEKFAKEKKAIYPNVMKSRITALKKLKNEDFASQREELQKKKININGASGLPKALGLGSNVSKAPKNPAVGAGGTGGFGGFGGFGGGSALQSSSLVNSNPVAFNTTDRGTPATANSAEFPEYKPVSTGLTVQKELDYLLNLLHTTEDLQKYGYTMDPPTNKELDDSRKGTAMSAGYEECDRCQTRFRVFPGRDFNGKLASGGKCTYHWGRATFPPRTAPVNSNEPGSNQRTYSCCYQYLGDSLGCVTAEYHVYKVSDVKRLATHWQFVRTPPSPRSSAEVPDTQSPLLVQKAYCLDCEMCYSTLGMEIVRLTLTDWPSGERVLDALVRPFGDIMDLNSRFSGISSKQFAEAKPYISRFSPGRHSGPQLADAKKPAQVVFDRVQCIQEQLEILPSPEAAREELFKYLTPDTPLLGHALENDLNVLRIIHDKIIDTSILFPHKKPFPVRNKLKWLVDKFLKYQIQSSEIGHDSAIDARCAGELVRHRIKGKWGLYEASEVGIIKDTLGPESPNAEVKPKKIQRVSPEELQAQAADLEMARKQQQPQRRQAGFTIADTLRMVEEAERVERGKEKEKKMANVTPGRNTLEEFVPNSPSTALTPSFPPLQSPPTLKIKPTPLPTPMPETRIPPIQVPLSPPPLPSLNKKRTMDDLEEAASTPVPAKSVRPTYAAALKGGGALEGSGLAEKALRPLGAAAKPQAPPRPVERGNNANVWGLKQLGGSLNIVKKQNKIRTPFIDQDEEEGEGVNDGGDESGGSSGVRLNMDLDGSFGGGGGGGVWGVNSH